MKKYFFLIIIFASIAAFFYLYPKERVISSFSTSLTERSPAQAENIRTAADKINGITLKPGEIFSFNALVGKRSSVNYQKAKTILGKTVEDAAGGGICQLSSTLYNAALWANLKITERHPHPVIVRSVGPGLDATVSYGFYDLKFKNTHDFPVKITVTINNSRLTAAISAPRRAADNKINITAETIPSGRQIIRTRTWREVISQNGEKRRELISEDAYTI